ncbi:MAG: phosphoenolpyruvate--protein phosphotransferase [Verrucomicrobia bacterium]|mgnify:CR=1 FL=1|jgi:phosphotransferase system enzyme I (PtsI)|nr:phosphoenolpyruvate--protein phosphotransferase [Verrucomicrobiota bacterium]|tara:strand:+ start:8865 stop:10631 length:1767 start_codon:yes stop_codon:yes gene_type:complete
MVTTDLETEITYTGIPASPGIAFGPIHVIARGFSAPEVYAIPEEDIAEEQERFTNAVDVTKKQLIDLQERLESLSGNKESEIFEAHVLLLEDQMLLGKVETAIRDRKQNAEYAFYAVMQNFLEAMRRIPDPYLRERTADIEDVCQRLLRNFAVDEEHSHEELDEKHILLAYDLSPSDTASSNRKHLLGFATEQGSVNSHTAILARSFGIPAVVGLDASVIQVTALTPAVIDGYSGKLILNPSQETLQKYISIGEEKEKQRTQLDAKRDEATNTTDGREIALSANIEFLQELHQVQRSGAKGVGLYRTEFLLLNGSEMPDENAQAEAYTKVAKETNPHLSIIRTLDAGGDKLPVESLTETEPNPFLGWRGIRVSLSRPAMFRDQLRAILRASAFGKVAVMFPLVSGLSELLQAREHLKRCMDELSAEGIPFDPKIPVGVMIEVPSAAVCADLLAPHSDFFSIGTNDLIQYTVAVDRGNPHVANLYKPTHPAVIRLIKKTVDAGRDCGIWTGVCGEMAGDIRLTPLLIGLGVVELSVSPQVLPRVGQVIRSLSYEQCLATANEALVQSNSRTIMDLTLSIATECYPDLLD